MPLSTAETVPIETPATLATSWIFGRLSSAGEGGRGGVDAGGAEVEEGRVRVTPLE
ncbi:MAG: hypothetical protein NVSMB3_14430 [Acidobacteriaceae bacterium]